MNHACFHFNHSAGPPAGRRLPAGRLRSEGPLYLPPEPIIEQATPAVTMPSRQEDAEATQGTNTTTSPPKGTRE